MFDLLTTLPRESVVQLFVLVVSMHGKWIALTLIQQINAALAVLGFLVAIGAINRMSPRTECTIILAFGTIAAGLFGYAIGSLVPDSWQYAFETLTVGGVVALLIGSRKHTVWVAPTWMPKISAGVSAITWVVFFGGVR